MTSASQSPLGTPELKKLTTPKPATKRNRTELTIWNGLEFGIGFWLAGVGVLIFGVPLLTCAALVVLAILGDTLRR